MYVLSDGAVLPVILNLREEVDQIADDLIRWL
jgi:hypothetical protein